MSDISLTRKTMKPPSKPTKQIASTERSTPATGTGQAPSTGAGVSRAKSQRTVQHPKNQNEVTRSLKTGISSNRERRVFGLLCVRVDAVEAVSSAEREELLRVAYQRLMLCVRTTDIVAVGEQGIFLIVANDLNSEDELEIVSDRIQSDCRKPYFLGEREIMVGMTIGGAGTDGGSAATELIGRA